MATSTQYAHLTIHMDRVGLRAHITTTDGRLVAWKAMRPSRYPQPGWLLRKAMRFALDSGWRPQETSTEWYVRDGVQTRNLEREVELCPNGQTPDECREIDPCEACTQDGDEWGDLCEESMGLR